MSRERLKLANLSKKFSGNYVVKDVSFSVEAGEIHALVGENGAGKSTMMKMITGEYFPDSGKIYHNGVEIHPRSISDSVSIGISMIHQELAPLMNMTIAENIFLGREILNHGILNKKEMKHQTAKILDEYGLKFSPETKVSHLSIAQMQMLEIIKAVSRNADVIIMDEPTSSLSDEESEKLFNIIDELKKKNVSVIYISHRLEEILRICDKITVLRDGHCIQTVDTLNVSSNQLVEMMVGRKLDQIYPKEQVEQRKVVIEVKNLNSGNRFKDISFRVHQGEILGISGLVGAGRSEIMSSIFGMYPLESGEIFLEGKKIIIKAPRDAIQNNLAMVSEDRRAFGLVLCRSIKENISLPNLREQHKGLFIDSAKEKIQTNQFIKALNIKTDSMEVITGNLSGGNQQKVVLAKWLLSNPKVLILDEPTRGIDVGANFEIYKIMVELARKGVAIIMISSELPEIIGMSDRILVVSDGKIRAEVTRNEILSGIVTQEDLLKSALQED